MVGKKNETTWAAKGLICFKPTRLSHRPLCQWWSVWPLTSGTRRSCGPRVSGSALRENIKGVHTIWASDWQSINHSSPATVQLQCAGVFFSSSCVPVSQSCTKTHTPHAVGHTKADVQDFIWLRRWVWAPLSILPPPLPHLWSPSLLSSTCVHAFFFFAGQAGRVLLSSTYFTGSDEAGWHSRTPAWPVPGWGWACTRCENKATLSRRGSGRAVSVIC